MALLAACGGSGSPNDQTTGVEASDSCDQLANQYIAANQEIVDAQAGASIRDFAREGFLAAPQSTWAKLSDFQGRALEDNCDQRALLTALLIDGHEIEERGAGGALAKGLLFAQASNALFWGPGSDDLSAFASPALAGTPSDSGALEDLESLDIESLRNCAAAFDAQLLYRQAELDWIASLKPSEMVGGATPAPPLLLQESRKPIETAVAKRSCEKLAPTAFLERADSLKAIGFFPNASWAEWVKGAWLDIQDDLVNIEIEARLVPVDPVAAGETATVPVEVTNTGSVPLFGVHVVNLTTEGETKPVLLSQEVLQPGDSETVDLPIAVPDDASKSHSFQLQVDASDPFGRVTTGSTPEELPIE